MAAKSAPDVMTPEQYIDSILAKWPELNEQQRRSFRTHANAWATVHYSDEIPQETREKLALLEEAHPC